MREQGARKFCKVLYLCPSVGLSVCLSDECACVNVCALNVKYSWQSQTEVAAAISWDFCMSICDDRTRRRRRRHKDREQKCITRANLYIHNIYTYLLNIHINNVNDPTHHQHHPTSQLRLSLSLSLIHSIIIPFTRISTTLHTPHIAIALKSKPQPQTKKPSSRYKYDMRYYTPTIHPRK